MRSGSGPRVRACRHIPLRVPAAPLAGALLIVECFEGRAGRPVPAVTLSDVPHKPRPRACAPPGHGLAVFPRSLALACSAVLRPRVPLSRYFVAAAHQSTPGPWCRGGVGLRCWQGARLVLQRFADLYQCLACRLVLPSCCTGVVRASSILRPALTLDFTVDLFN